MVKKLHLKRIRYRNNQDYDVLIRDAFGNEHLLFPKEEKELVVLTKGKNDDRSKFGKGR